MFRSNPVSADTSKADSPPSSALRKQWGYSAPLGLIDSFLAMTTLSFQNQLASFQGTSNERAPIDSH